MMKLFNLLIVSIFAVAGLLQTPGNVKIGDNAPDFRLKTISGKEIRLNKLNTKNPVVLVVLRGWPGYQCPICTRQVGELMANSDEFQKRNAIVLMVYPGPSEKLQEHAREFSGDFDFPGNFYFVIDPDYSMVNKYGLRWDAPKETAYPSTFVIDKNGKVIFAKTSTTHGGRATSDEILGALK